MSTYFIAQIEVQDWDEYQKSLDGTDRLLARFKAEILTVDNHPLILEGGVALHPHGCDPFSGC